MIGVGLSLTQLALRRRNRNGWWEPGALFDLDDENSRFYVNGEVYPTLAEAVAAMGGSASGQALTVGPHLTGEILYQSDFAAGIEGWADTTGFEATGDPSNSSSRLRLTTTGTYKAQRTVSLPEAKAVLLAASTVAWNNTQGAVLLQGGTNITSGNGSVNAPINLIPPPRSTSILVGSSPSQVIVGFGISGSGWVEIDSVSAQEALPYDGFSQGGLSFEFDATFPASASGNKVLAQWGCDDEDWRVRLVWDASAVLRLIVTNANTEQANLNLGTITGGTRHTIRGSAAPNAFYANLDGGQPVLDVSGTMPPLGKFWRGRSFTGEAFDGTFHRSKAFPTAKIDPNELIDPSRAMFIAGDSIGNGDGATTKWFQGLGSPVRAYHEVAAAGESSAQMLARVLAVAGFYRRWPLVMMDAPNTGEDAATWLANVKAAGQSWDNGDWFIIPPAQNVNEAPADKISTIQAALLSDPDFAGHTLDEVEQAAYLAEVADPDTRGDNVHFNDTGQAIQRTYVAANRGW